MELHVSFPIRHYCVALYLKYYNILKPCIYNYSLWTSNGVCTNYNIITQT